MWTLLLWIGALSMTGSYEAAVMGNQPTAIRFLNGVNLAFHEAGHALFQPFGEFMMILGGSLLQIMVPLVVAAAFLYRSNNFGASVALWWAGQSIMGVAIYIRDARELRLILLGGVTGGDRAGYHDWENLLTRLGLLEHEKVVAALTAGAGVVLMLVALLWGGILLWRQHQTMGAKR